MSQQPTFHITKEHFVGVINSLHEQYVKDRNSAEAFGEIFNTEAGLYDNSLLINSVFSFLHEVFPKDEDGHSEIEHYCYVLNFGKNGEEYESPEELFNRLMLDKGVMWFETPDGPLWCSVDDLKLKDPHLEEARKHFYPVAPEEAFLQESGLKTVDPSTFRLETHPDKISPDETA